MQKVTLIFVSLRKKCYLCNLKIRNSNSNCKDINNACVIQAQKDYRH